MMRAMVAVRSGGTLALAQYPRDEFMDQSLSQPLITAPRQQGDILGGGRWAQKLAQLISIEG